MGFYRFPGNGGKGGKAGLFAKNFDEHALGAPTVEFPVKDPFPRAKIEPALGHRHDNLPTHQSAFEMGIGVILGPVVPVLGMGFFRGEFFQPFFKILVQAGFVIVDKDGGGDVHGVDEAESFPDAGFHQGGLDLGCDVEKSPAGGGAESEFLAERLHFLPGERVSRALRTTSAWSLVEDLASRQTSFPW